MIISARIHPPRLIFEHACAHSLQHSHPKHPSGGQSGSIVGPDVRGSTNLQAVPVWFAPDVGIEGGARAFGEGDSETENSRSVQCLTYTHVRVNGNAVALLSIHFQQGIAFN